MTSLLREREDPSVLGAGVLPKARLPYVVRVLSPEDIPDMVDLQSAVVATLPDEQKDFITELCPDGYQECFDNGHQHVGIFETTRGKLIAQATLMFPKVRMDEAGVFGMKLDAAPSTTAVLCGDLVHPSSTGNGLHHKLIKLRLSLAQQFGKAHAISSICTTNVRSWRSYINSGMHIQGMDANPAISPHTVYFLHRGLETLKGQAANGFNDVSTRPVPATDLETQDCLLAQGYRGTRHVKNSDEILFSKRARIP